MRIFLVVCFAIGILLSIYLLRDGNHRIVQAAKEDDLVWILQMTVGFLGAIFAPPALIVSVVLLFL